MLGIYIHVPFCLKKCPYCDFYSLRIDDELCEKYVSALIKSFGKFPEKLKCDTIYFGGGTPSLLEEKHFDKILNALYSHFEIDNNAEISFEANPAACSKEKLKSLRKIGLNRISVGVQSFDEDELSFLGRLHSSNDAESTIIDAFSAGFDNISVDLMICLPNQTEEIVKKNIIKAKNLGAAHISSYMLKIEENTPFSKMKFALPDDDFCAEIYLYNASFLEKCGFLQYEISNFSKNGYECRHNLKYWKREEYLGFGPSAHSFYQNKRFAYSRDLSEFISNPFETYVTDINCDEFEESLMLNLRLKSGFDTSEFPEKKDKLLNKAKVLKDHGLLNIENDIIMLTKRGYLISNSIICNLIYNM